MDFVNIPFSSIRPDGMAYATDGLHLTSDHMRDILTFNQVPTTLLSIDKKYGTTTTLDVLNTLETEAVVAAVDGSRVQILDPRSRFVSDEDFDELVNRFQQNLDVKISENGFAKTATFDCPTTESDSFLGDLFSKSIKLDRLPQGGLSLNIGLLRLACTNGMRIKDSQYTHLLRSGRIDNTLLDTFRSDSLNFNVDEYFKNLFTKDGEFLEASVSDYLSMKDLLSKLTDPDIADLYYPLDPITSHYSAQDIDITKINRSILNRLPAGVRYYDAFNFLTNAAKQVENITLDDQIKIADFARPSHLESLRKSDVRYKGHPHFDDALVSALRGDRPMKLI